MILLNEKKECCGCGVCAESCPARCIRMEEDAEGFLYPAVQADACTGCGLCERICPMRHPAPERAPSEVWAARNNDAATRTGSSSGGIFLPLARLTLRKGGLVFGAAFEPDTFGGGTIRHRSATCEEELATLAKSKYAQSDTSGTFREVARALDQGREVLYTGTPCQIAGLRAFLRGRSTDRLVTAECLCHGAPSPGLLRRYLQELTEGHPILGIDFRDKRDGWRKYRFTVRTARRTYSITARKDVYFRAFLDDWTLRPSCYACPFKSGRSGSDLSLGDFWNVREVLPESDDDRGTSLVLAYTQSGAGRLAELFAATDESGRPAFDSQRLEWDGRIRRRNGGFKTEVEIPAARTALFDELAASERVTRPLFRHIWPGRIQRLKRLLHRITAYKHHRSIHENRITDPAAQLQLRRRSPGLRAEEPPDPTGPRGMAHRQPQTPQTGEQRLPEDRPAPGRGVALPPQGDLRRDEHPADAGLQEVGD